MVEAKTVEAKSIAGMPIVDVQSVEDYINALFYGNPGVGKTYLTASASLDPSLCPVLFVDIDGGILTLKNRFPNVDVIQITDTVNEKTGKVTTYAWQKIASLYEHLRRGSEYKTIIVDSITEAERRAMSWVMHKVVEKDSERDPDVPAQRDWGKSGELVRQMVRAYRDLPCNVLFTAHEKQLTDDGGNITDVVPSLPGKLAFQIAGFVDIVGYMYASVKKKEEDDVDRFIMTQPAKKRIAKDRSGNLPFIMKNATMEEIAKLVLGASQ